MRKRNNRKVTATQQPNRKRDPNDTIKAIAVSSRIGSEFEGDSGLNVGQVANTQYWGKIDPEASRKMPANSALIGIPVGE